jgi:hypothetical protein
MFVFLKCCVNSLVAKTESAEGTYKNSDRGKIVRMKITRMTPA